MNLIRIRIPTLKQQWYLYLILPTVYVKYTDLCNDIKVILSRVKESVHVLSTEHISTLPASCSIHHIYGLV